MCEKIFWEETPIPNWPKAKYVKKENFSIYCTPVNQAIINWLKRNKKTVLLKKFLSSNKEKITKTGIKIIKEVYSEEVDIILMKSWY